MTNAHPCIFIFHIDVLFLIVTFNFVHLVLKTLSSFCSFAVFWRGSTELRSRTGLPCQTNQDESLSSAIWPIPTAQSHTFSLNLERLQLLPGLLKDSKGQNMLGTQSEGVSKDRSGQEWDETAYIFNVQKFLKISAFTGMCRYSYIQIYAVYTIYIYMGTCIDTYCMYDMYVCFIEALRFADL